MNEIKRPILGNGQEYVVPYERDKGVPKNDTRPSFDVARARLLNELSEVRQKVKSFPSEYKLDEVIVNLRMNLNYSSKSYHPSTVIEQSQSEEVGTKKWTKDVIDKKNNVKIKFGKDIFLRIREDKLDEFELFLKKSEENYSKKFVEDIRSIEELYFDDHSNIVKIFNSEWKEGRIELVIHPFGGKEDEVISRLLELIRNNGGDPSKTNIRSYYPGPIFISAFMKRNTLEKVLPFNPIRTVHPLEFRGLPELRGGLTDFKVPKQPSQNLKSNITLGIFDGGINSDIPLLKNFTTEYNPIPTSKSNDFLQHGIGVVGAALYGDLRKYSSTDILPTPAISIDSYRVFPLSDPKDFDLYEVIDVIERIVPNRPDIKVYNLSLGPYGTIEDDYISRFTYVIDHLSKDNKRWFAIAVGNDGDMPLEEERRIQAPADAVNNIGVGAYTFDNNNIVRAPYSCIGDGREGCKVKPDLVAFGGCDRVPFQLIGIDGINRLFAQGTSFASPLVASKAAEIIGRCNIADPLLARTLLIHTANHPEGKHDKYLGFGALCEEIDNILGCSENKVTVVYQSKLLPKKFAKLIIPFVHDLNYSGKVQIEYTIAIMTNVNPQNTEDYTLSCIEDTFYPNTNIHVYTYTDPVTGKKKALKRHLIKHKHEIETLLSNGWKKSGLPASDPRNANKYKTEQERKNDFKWDTIVKRRIPFAKYSAIQNPYLAIHAMGRRDSVVDELHYAVAVTIDYCDYAGDAYEKTLQIYNKLQATQVRNLNEVFVRY